MVLSMATSRPWFWSRSVVALLLLVWSDGKLSVKSLSESTPGQETFKCSNNSLQTDLRPEGFGQRRPFNTTETWITTQNPISSCAQTGGTSVCSMAQNNGELTHHRLGRCKMVLPSATSQIHRIVIKTWRDSPNKLHSDLSGLSLWRASQLDDDGTWSNQA
jgi:hypothetical protein